LISLIQSKELSPVEVIDATIERIVNINPILNAFCLLDLEAARQKAVNLEEKILSGQRVGALVGLPIGVKDLICTKDMVTTSGSIAYRDFLPEEDDIVVERLKSADAIILGKTNASEFGYGPVSYNSVYPTTKNPWSLDCSPGGSSAGTGAAVASGMGSVGIGSDGGGSIRLPAAFCGIYGFKASMGRVPLYPGTRDERYPGVSSWESIEHIGPLSRTVRDSALIMNVIAGPDDRDRHSLPKAHFDWVECIQDLDRPLRVAYSKNLGYAMVDKEVEEIIDNAVKCISSATNWEVEQVDPGWDDPMADFWALVALESDLAGIRDLVEKYPNKMTPEVTGLASSTFTSDDFNRAILGRKKICNIMWRFMRNYDIFITPTVSIPAFRLDQPNGPNSINGRPISPLAWIPFTFPINMTGQPAASVPVGHTKAGLPVGLQIVGRHLDDPTVLQASSVFESVLPWKERWPML
jgi:aspartyl-tRNA(Asn)/glutamyl-tRNA(Gln) amidotransferase subunit A